MVNKFKQQAREKKDVAQKKEEYDWVDSKGKGWRLKKGEKLPELKLRAVGKGSHTDVNRSLEDRGKEGKFKESDEKKSKQHDELEKEKKKLAKKKLADQLLKKMKAKEIAKEMLIKQKKNKEAKKSAK